MTKLKPGVVFGEDYLTLIQACKDGGYALPAVNVIGTHSANAVMEAAAKNKSDVIIQVSNGGAQFFAGKGLENSFDAKILGAISFAQHVHMMAEHYGICVVLHTDHADKKLIPWVEELLAQGQTFYKMTGKPLYTSHMVDLSAEPIDYNISESARLLEIAAEMEMSIEIELGCTGGEEDGVGSDEIDNDKLYTQPEDCLQAFEKLAPIGHFSLAASFGNVHGVYKPGNVKLRPEILKNSQELLEKAHNLDKNPYDLVFHGGSGSDKSKIEEALKYGVFKMNIDTDTQFAFAKGVGDYVMGHEKSFKYQIDPETGEPHKKNYDPRAWIRKGELSMIDRLDEAFKDLKSAGKTLALSDKND